MRLPCALLRRASIEMSRPNEGCPMKSSLHVLASAPVAALLLAQLSVLPAAAQEKSNTAAASPVATVNGKAIMQSQLDMLVRERVAQGQQDSPELRNFLKQELINREVILQESLKRGLDKN